jgi:hypothetical protein
MKIDDDTKRFTIRRLKWSLIYVGIGIVLILALPFPYDLASVLGLYFLINFFRDRSILKKYGVKGGIKEMFGSIGSFSLSSISRNEQSIPLKYYCMICGKEHREIACPNCGSKMKRVG